MNPIPHHQERDRGVLPLLEERDTPWISALVDELEHAVGRPWRDLLERIERLSPRTSSVRTAAVVQAMRALLGGRVKSTVDPKRARRTLFGAAATDDAARAARIASTAKALKTSAEDLEEGLWRDLPAERIVVLPNGRPSELAVAAEANLRLIQRALMRCYDLRLEVRGNARSIVRTAAVRGYWP